MKIQMEKSAYQSIDLFFLWITSLTVDDQMVSCPASLPFLGCVWYLTGIIINTGAVNQFLIHLLHKCLDSLQTFLEHWDCSFPFYTVLWYEISSNLNNKAWTLRGGDAARGLRDIFSGSRENSSTHAHLPKCLTQSCLLRFLSSGQPQILGAYVPQEEGGRAEEVLWNLQPESIHLLFGENSSPQTDVPEFLEAGLIAGCCYSHWQDLSWQAV